MFQASPKRAPLAALVLSASLLSACAAVGPDYAGPPSAGSSAVAAGAFHRAAAAHASTAPPAARWWTALGDPVLTQLIDEALARSPTLQAAEARLRSARAGLRQSRAQSLPSGGATALAASASLPGSALAALNNGRSSGGASSLDLYSVGFDASWELDLFGGTRRAIEGAAAQAGVQAADLDDARVQLAAEVGQAYVGLREAQARLALARDAVALQQKTLDLTRQRQARGAAAEGDIERVQTGLDQAQAEVAPLAAQADQMRDELAVLTGQAPGALDQRLAADAPAPTPPTATAVGDPAQLLRRRPDIRAAERRLAANAARIGQDEAELFPKVRLLGDIGFTAGDPAKLLRGDSFSAIGAPSLSWNILDYPRLKAQVRGAEADRDAAAAQYQAAVLSALQDAEASLSRYGAQRESLAALIRAEASADRAEAVIQRRYQAGAASLIDLMDAQRQVISARQARAEAQAGLTNDYIALQKSLGLGWGEPSFGVASETGR